MAAMTAGRAALCPEVPVAPIVPVTAGAGPADRGSRPAATLALHHSQGGGCQSSATGVSSTVMPDSSV
jgi:hypothetical protein